ncbi:hypothetical protein ABMA28_003541 [Loxostege sticticalis]|uniref:Uncharacterized protein n=1 Tax=Loxostege sticticalis TaxID=481309 RepID=A0ABD0SWM9_LOXSC
MGNKRWRKPKISLKLMRKRKAQHAIASRIQKAQKNISDAVEPLSDSTSTIVINTVAQHSSVDTEPCNLSTPVRFNESLCETNDNILLSTESKPYEEKKFGRRIINVSQFFNHLQQISSHGPLDCGLQSVEIISETRAGLVSKLKCKIVHFLNVFFFLFKEEYENLLVVSI